MVASSSSKPQGRVKQRPDFIFPPDNASATASPVSPALPYDLSLFKPRPKTKPKAKRKPFRGHGWSRKGTKASRSRAKRKLLQEPANSSAYAPNRPPLPPSAISSPSRPLRPMRTPPSSPVTPGRPKCAVPTCTRYTTKKKYLPGYWTYCFDHRSLENSPPPAPTHDVTSDVPLATRFIDVPLATRLVDPPAIVRDVTDHPSDNILSRELQTRALDLSPNFPRLRRAKCVYAYAEGLHTVFCTIHNDFWLHYAANQPFETTGPPARAC